MFTPLNSLARVWRWLAHQAHIAWLHWLIDCNESWLRAAARDDVDGTLNLTLVRLELDALRCRLGAAYSGVRA